MDKVELILIDLGAERIKALEAENAALKARGPVLSEIRHAILVYRIKSTGEIVCAYADGLPPTTNDPDLEHLATVNPRLWVQHNWDKVETKR